MELQIRRSVPQDFAQVLPQWTYCASIDHFVGLAEIIQFFKAVVRAMPELRAAFELEGATTAIWVPSMESCCRATPLEILAGFLLFRFGWIPSGTIIINTLPKTISCRYCGDPFVPSPSKPGYIDECPRCLCELPKKRRDVDLQRQVGVDQNIPRPTAGNGPRPVNAVLWFVVAVLSAIVTYTIIRVLVSIIDARS
jgi:hypothetical protein